MAQLVKQRSSVPIYSPKKMGGVYILIAICIVFSGLDPSQFPTVATIQEVFDGNAVLALIALPLIVPLSAGVFDLSTSYTLSLTGVLSAELITSGRVGLTLTILITIAVAVGVGLVNGLIVVGLRIDSFIGTLASGSLISAAVIAVSQDTTIVGAQLAGPFKNIGQSEFLGFILPVFYAIGLAAVLWYLMKYTATGRRLYAIGFNERAASLAGIKVKKLQFMALVVSSTLSGFAGIVYASIISAGSPTAGSPYLLSAFAAVFLGATQFKEGRFNAEGTLIAVLLLGVGTTGLGLEGASEWVQSGFTGVVLIGALAVTGAQRREGGTKLTIGSWWSGLRGFRGGKNGAANTVEMPELKDT
jgi:ribose transport system permease protein